LRSFICACSFFCTCPLANGTTATTRPRLPAVLRLPTLSLPRRSLFRSFPPKSNNHCCCLCRRLQFCCRSQQLQPTRNLSAPGAGQPVPRHTCASVRERKPPSLPKFLTA